MNPGMFGYVGQSSGGAIRSIQRGVISLSGLTTATATISPVVTSKSELRLLGVSTASTNDMSSAMIYLTLTNPTTITATRSGSAYSASVSWELTEWA